MIPPTNPSNRKTSPVAAALAQAQVTGPQPDSIAELIEAARKRVRDQMQAAQVSDPSAEDLRLAESILRPFIEVYVTQARQAGQALTLGMDELLRLAIDEIFGFGPLAPYLADESIEEIICNGPQDIWVIHAERGKEKVGAQFRTAEDLTNFVNRAVRGNRQMNKTNPKLDARMRDGSRLHAVMEPLTVNLPIAVTIRRHRLIAQTVDDLMRLGTLTPPAGEFLKLAVRARLNIIIAGATASGKTNFINALSDAANDSDRFIIIEDTPELQVRKADVVQLCTRERQEEARAFTIADLVIEALRMRPDRIITGEARGSEVVDVLKAANTGHDGQMLTVHANSPRDVIQRMETMYLMSGVDVPLVAIRRQIADAFQLIVFLKRVFIGQHARRFVTEIAEIQPSQFMEGERVVVQNIYEDKGQGLAWTNYFPERLAHRMSEGAVPLRPTFFRA
jgi:pilus assembly protein CpaF